MKKLFLTKILFCLYISNCYGSAEVLLNFIEQGDEAGLMRELQSQKYADVINDQDEIGCTPLHMAAYALNYEMCFWLLWAGADKTIANIKNEVPIAYVTRQRAGGSEEARSIRDLITEWSEDPIK